MTDPDLSPAEIDARFTAWLAVLRRQPSEDHQSWAIRGSYLLDAAPDVTQRGPGRRGPQPLKAGPARGMCKYRCGRPSQVKRAVCKVCRAKGRRRAV